MRIITLELRLRVLAKLDDGHSVRDFIDELDYNITPPDYASIDDTEILDYETKDSR